jgi:molybdenum-dependent DNA-binding transcriptional regulator ModE
MTELKLRILFDDAMLGPGKAALLGHIRDTGSISAAGRRMGMSYKRGRRRGTSCFFPASPVALPRPLA